MEVSLLGLKEVYTHNNVRASNFCAIVEQSTGRINHPIETQTTRFEFFVRYLIGKFSYYQVKEKLAHD